MRRRPILNLALWLCGLWWSGDTACRQCHAQATAPTEADIAAIRQQWADWRAKIVTLEFTERMWNRTLLERRFPEIAGLPEAEFIDLWTTRTRWRWSDTWNHQMLIERLERGRVVSRTLTGSDGKQGYDATTAWGVDAAANWEQLRLMPPGRDTFGMRSVSSLRIIPGLWLSAVSEENPTALEWKPDEDWNGISCARFRVSLKNTHHMNVEIWLDRRHSALPCRVLTEHVQPEGNHVNENQVLEFMELIPTVWFPRSGYDGVPDKIDDWYAWRVEQASVNTLKPADFRPPEPNVGTLIINADGSLRRHGVNSPDDRVKHVASEARQGVAAPDTPIVAAPLQDRTWWLIAIAAIILLGIAAGGKLLR